MNTGQQSYIRLLSFQGTQSTQVLFYLFLCSMSNKDRTTLVQTCVTKWKVPILYSNEVNLLTVRRNTITLQQTVKDLFDNSYCNYSSTFGKLFLNRNLLKLEFSLQLCQKLFNANWQSVILIQDFNRSGTLFNIFKTSRIFYKNVHKTVQKLCTIQK